jgi:SAM-dependent methyltransferase
MEIHSELSDVSRYLASKQHLRLEDMKPDYDAHIRAVSKFKPIAPSSRMIEVGTGTGWFPLLCEQSGLHCEGLEISPQLIEHAEQWGARYGLKPKIRLGNIEEAGIGENLYDVVWSNSVFEHIEQWRLALNHIYTALKPGGALFFISTNKFRFKSSEYDFPLYDWLPDQMRYRLRVARQGPEIMKLGIDFNQFRYPQLRRVFRETGFTKIYDRIDVSRVEGEGLKHRMVRMARSNPLLREVILTFCDATVFVCLK